MDQLSRLFICFTFQKLPHIIDSISSAHCIVSGMHILMLQHSNASSWKATSNNQTIFQGDAHTLYRQNETEGFEFQLKNTPVK